MLHAASNADHLVVHRLTSYLQTLLLIVFGGCCAISLFVPLTLALPLYIAATSAQTLLVLYHADTSLGIRSFGLFVGLTLVITYLAEYLSTHYGFPFGFYAYTPSLGPQLFGVPFPLPVAWLAMLYPSWQISRAILGGADRPIRNGLIVPAVGGLLMVSWDLVLDPGLSTGAGFWVWAEPGPYFGIPLVNFLGWWLVAFLVLVAFERLARPIPNDLPSNRKPQAILPFALYLGNLLLLANLCAKFSLVEIAQPRGFPRTVYLGGAAWVALGLAVIIVLALVLRLAQLKSAAT